MKILPGTRVNNFKEAANLAFHEAGADDMSLAVADLFEAADATKLCSEARLRYQGHSTHHRRFQ